MTLGNDLGYKCTLLIPLLRHKLILTYYKTKDTFILIINPLSLSLIDLFYNW